MATRHSTGLVPAFPSGSVPPPIPICPAIIRGQIVYAVSDVAFMSFRQAARAWSAAECHRLDLVDLVAQRTEALAEMRAAATDMARFREADLAANVRRLRSEVCRHG